MVDIYDTNFQFDEMNAAFRCLKFTGIYRAFA